MTFDRMIVLDFETTGLQPGYRPLEIAWLEFDSLYKVLGSDPGASKVTKANELKIPIIDAAKFQQLLDSGTI